MNITISQISNGWVIAIASPKGNTALYCDDFEAVIDELKQMTTPPDNSVSLPRG